MKKILIVLLLIGVLFIGGCVGEEKNYLEQQIGTIRNCEWTMSVCEENFGKCYCLETPERGCEIIEYSNIGDLAYAVNKTIAYEGTRENLVCTRMCPCYIKLFSIEILGIQQQTNCAKEGEQPTDFDFTTGKPVPEGKPCCEGLKAIGPKSYDEISGICGTVTGVPGVCRSCGDDICNPDYEDKCNCPEDCK